MVPAAMTWTNSDNSGLLMPYGDRAGSSMAQVMASCPMATSHYLNWYWLIVKFVLWHSPANDLTRVLRDYPCMEFTLLKLPPNLSMKYSKLWRGAQASDSPSPTKGILYWDFRKRSVIDQLHIWRKCGIGLQPILHSLQWRTNVPNHR